MSRLTPLLIGAAIAAGAFAATATEPMNRPWYDDYPPAPKPPAHTPPPNPKADKRKANRVKKMQEKKQRRRAMSERTTPWPSSLAQRP